MRHEHSLRRDYGMPNISTEGLARLTLHSYTDDTSLISAIYYTYDHFKVMDGNDDEHIQYKW